MAQPPAVSGYHFILRQGHHKLFLNPHGAPLLCKRTLKLAYKSRPQIVRAYHYAQVYANLSTATLSVSPV